MDEKTQANGPDPGVGQGGGTADPARRSRPAWPTRQERLARIRDYQAKALQTGDPHLANLELFDGDAMLLAFRLRESLDRELTGEGAPPEAAGRFAHQAGMLLKCLRQLDRNARLQQQMQKQREE